MGLCFLPGLLRLSLPALWMVPGCTGNMLVCEVRLLILPEALWRDTVILLCLKGSAPGPARVP